MTSLEGEQQLRARDELDPVPQHEIGGHRHEQERQEHREGEAGDCGGEPRNPAPEGEHFVFELRREIGDVDVNRRQSGRRALRERPERAPPERPSLASRRRASRRSSTSRVLSATTIVVRINVAPSAHASAEGPGPFLFRSRA